MSWILHMAWRDSRRQRRRLVFYTAAIAIGIAHFCHRTGCQSHRPGCSLGDLDLVDAGVERGQVLQALADRLLDRGVHVVQELGVERKFVGVDGVEDVLGAGAVAVQDDGCNPV